MKRLPLRWSIIIPLVALAVTVSLSIVGKHEAGRINSEGIVWDYLAPAEVILHSMNYPAAVGALLLAPNHNLRIGIEYSLSKYVIYLVFVCLLWASAGFYMDRGIGMPRGRPWRITVAASIIAYSVLLVAIALTSWNVYPLLLGLSGLVWGAALTAFAIRLLSKKLGLD